jgi:hypothetical protein
VWNDQNDLDFGTEGVLNSTVFIVLIYKMKIWLSIDHVNWCDPFNFCNQTFNVYIFTKLHILTDGSTGTQRKQTTNVPFDSEYGHVSSSSHWTHLPLFIFAYILHHMCTIYIFFFVFTWWWKYTYIFTNIILWNNN